MLYENTLVLYGADNYLIEQRKENDKINEMVDRLRGIDSELDELLDALLYLKGGHDDILAPLDANLMMEYGLITNDVLMEHEARRVRILHMVKSNKSIDHILEAIQHLMV